MQVTEGVDVEDVRETGSETQVLEKTREHVPRVALRTAIQR